MGKDAEVIVIGSGLAGMSAAFELTARGKHVLVLEANGHIGGRTASWLDDGMAVESGLHKFLGIYRALPALLRACGTDPNDILTWVDAVEMHTRDGKHAFFGAAPYHHAISTLRGIIGNNGFIQPREKLRLALFGMRGVARCIRSPHTLDRQNVAQAAREAGVSRQIIDDVLHTSTSAVLFLPADRFSMYAMFSPVVEGLKRGMTFRIGAFNGGMTDVMMRPIAAAIESHGGEIRTGAAVRRLIVEGERVIGVTTDRETLHAPAIILATGLHPAQGLMSDAFPEHPWFKPMLQLKTLSAVTLQCETDRPIYPTDHTHFSNTALACFAEQSHTTFRGSPGRFSSILFPPDEILDAPPEKLFDQAEEAARLMGFSLRQHVIRYRTIRHAHDFYAMIPGSETLRPTQRTPISGFALAGDYTRQPFSASMEGAVLSGKRAAAALT